MKKPIGTIFVDLHGVVIASSTANAWIARLLEAHAKGWQIVAATNSASLTTAQVQAQVPQLAQVWTHVLTTGIAITTFVQEHRYKRIAFSGNPHLQSMIEKLPGMDCVAPPDIIQKPDCIVLTRDKKLNLRQIEASAHAIEAGAACAISSVDITIPSDNGWEIGPGIILVMLQALLSHTTFTPTVVGKPSPFFLRYNKFQSEATTYVIGDSETDKAWANTFGATYIDTLQPFLLQV